MRVSLVSLFVLVPATFAATWTVSFDTIYDDSSLSTDNIACSIGPNGLKTQGFTTIGQLPTWPRVGGATAIAGVNSPNCGSCWTLMFNGTSVTITAIDHAVGFVIAEAAMNQLTHNQAEFLRKVNATVVQVPKSMCGL